MSKITAGKALDTLLAKTLGWTDIAPTGLDEEPDLEGYHALVGYTPIGHVRLHIPRWSTDLGAALRLLEEENKKGMGFSLLGGGYSLWACIDGSVIPCGNGWSKLGFMISTNDWFDTPALAIVMGILQAHGVNVEAELADQPEGGRK